MKAKLRTNREKGTFRGVLVSQMNLQAGVPLVGTVECVIVHVRPGSQPMLAALDGKKAFPNGGVFFCRKQGSSRVFSTLCSPKNQIVVLFLQINVVCRLCLVGCGGFFPKGDLEKLI